MEKKQSPIMPHAMEKLVFRGMKRSCMKMEKFVFRGMKKKRGSKKLVVRGVTHWIKFEDYMTGFSPNVVHSQRYLKQMICCHVQFHKIDGYSRDDP